MVCKLMKMHGVGVKGEWGGWEVVLLGNEWMDGKKDHS